MFISLSVCQLIRPVQQHITGRKIHKLLSICFVLVVVLDVMVWPRHKNGRQKAPGQSLVLTCKRKKKAEEDNRINVQEDIKILNLDMRTAVVPIVNQWLTDGKKCCFI